MLRPTDLVVLQVSENVERWLGCSVQDLLGQPVARVFGSGGQTRLREFLRTETTENNPIYAFTLDPRGDSAPLDVIVHTTGGVAVVELEATDRGEEKPEPDYYASLKKSVSRLQATSSLRDFCESVCEEVRSLSGLDRVMVYRFHEDGHGEVVAESRRFDLVSWLGLHYPAEDIPQPAREVFKQIWIRPVPDVGAELSELVPLPNPDTGKPLTMTHCALRGPSIMYTEYLQNMGVKAALTMPIRREVWPSRARVHGAPRLRDGLARPRLPGGRSLRRRGERPARGAALALAPERLALVSPGDDPDHDVGGNPHEKPTVPGPNGPRLTPRKSFELFVESVAQRSLAWKSVEIDAASRLRVLLIELVVDQAERLADLNADLLRSNEDVDTLEVAARMSGLTQRLYRVMSGDACLELLQGSGAPPLRPSVLLLDLNTPGMGGREALVAIRAEPALRELPVVVLSTSSNPNDLAHGYGHGVNAYHLKPFRYDDHLQLLRDIFTYWLRRVELPERSGSDR